MPGGTRAWFAVWLLVPVGALPLPGIARGDVVFDSFDAGGAFHPANNLTAAAVRSAPASTLRAAARFTVCSGAFTLDSVTLPISLQRNVSDDLLRVRLTEDEGGAPGATLEVLSENEDIWPTFANPFTATTTLPSTLHPPLVAGSSYWIVTEPTAIPASTPHDVDFRWFESASGPPTGFRQQQQFSASLPADPWSGAVLQARAAVRVEGTPQGAPDVPFECVPVGTPGNACETQPGQGCFGAVAYDYAIGRYEVTNAEYAAFLNAVAMADTHGVWNPQILAIARSGSAGSYGYSVASGSLTDPVNAITFYSALRYANWLHNGRPTGPQNAATTEDGAYTFSGSTSVGPRNPAARFALPTEDEWYKAAYYDAPSSSYFDFPTRSNTQTTCSSPSNFPNTANCHFAYGSPSAVGSYPASASPSGSFDQGGNVWEWNETEIGANRGVRGGSYAIESPAGHLSSLARADAAPDGPPEEIYAVGFRVVSLPEPAAALQLAAGLVATLALARRRAAAASGAR